VNQPSTTVLGDSVSALGFQIAFYYGLTGLACVIYYRHALLRSVTSFVVAGVLPMLGFLSLAAVFVKAWHDYSQPASTTRSRSWASRSRSPSESAGCCWAGC
jgi:hypothetical protein